MRDHRRLRVWRKAHDLAIEVRRAAESFPRVGYAELRGQMIRSDESIVTNLVEGCGSASQREFARFLDISIKSASELQEQLELAHDNGVLPTERFRALTAEAVDVRKMLYGLRARVLAAV